MRQGNEPPDGEAVAGCASEDAQPADLGLLLSQILTAPAFPRAASEHAVRSAAADIGITDVGDEPDLELRELRVAPGMVRAIGHRHFGRKGGGRRRAISGFSDASRRNLLRRLGTLDFSVVRGIPVVITLTYPADWRPWCATGADAKQQLVSFRREWAKRWGEFQGIWKLEFQPRHSQPEERRFAPHFHILAVVPAADPAKPVFQATSLTDVREWVSLTWWNIVGSENADHLKAGTRVDDADGEYPGRVVAYFAGYTAGRTKEEQHKAPANWPGLGRFWGVVGIPSVEVSTHLTEAEFFAVRRVLAELLARRRGGRRRSLRRGDDGIWLALDNAPELVGRLTRWLHPEPFTGPGQLP